jgi:hypothetical protein
MSRARDLPVPTRAPDDVRRVADEVLARREFRRPEPSLFDRAQEWVAEQLERVFESLAGGGRGSLVGLVLLVLLVGAVVWLALRLGRTVGGDPRVRMPEAVVEDVRSAQEWRAEAERAEAEGRWREGVRYRHRALVAELAERGVVEEVPGRTAGEYRRDIAGAAPEVADDVAAATDLFERVWYGDLRAGAAERDRFGALADRVLTGASR